MHLPSDPSAFPLFLVSAWNESGGGFFHRLLDGHNELACWPFEIQLGTAASLDVPPGWFHRKYRWPVFPGNLAEAAPELLFDSVIDEELKGRIADPAGSKFAAFDLRADLPAWRAGFAARWMALPPEGRTRAAAVAAYVAAFFPAWTNRHVPAPGREKFYAGHCPVVGLDAEAILSDFSCARIVQIVRSPFPGFADMRSRHPSLDPAAYAAKWSRVNGLAYRIAEADPARYRLVRHEDVLAQRRETLGGVAAWLGIGWEDGLLTPSWNGTPLARPGPPFGGVQVIGLDHETTAAASLDPATREILAAGTEEIRTLLNYSA